MKYIVVASVCLSLFYIAYRLIHRKETNFRQLRIYLLGSMALSLLFPLSSYRINTGLSLFDKKPGEIILVDANRTNQPIAPTQELNNFSSDKAMEKSKILADLNWLSVVFKLYFVMTLLLLFRIIMQFTILAIQYFKSDKIKLQDCVLLYNHRFKNTFSFFRWIFIYDGTASQDELNQIITHEKIHVVQYHSFDLLVMELLTAVMWFNPMVWMMKNSIQLVHEYLADEGALNTGIDRLRYQALLINQVTEEKLICLSSSFNPVCRPGRHSLIKKRMIMMTKNKINQKVKLKLLALIPVSTALFFMIGILNGLLAENVQAGNPESPTSIKEIGDQMVIHPENQAIVRDTIKTKTVVKIVNSKNPGDTLVKEYEEVIVTDDSIKHKEAVWQVRTDADAEHNAVFIHVDEDGNTEMNEIHGDSVKIVKVIKYDKGGKEEIVKETKQLKIRNSNGQGPSKILYIIDGVPSADKDIFSKLDVEQIKLIEVMKDSEIKKYTADNFDGVIIITTNAGKKKE